MSFNNKNLVQKLFCCRQDRLKKFKFLWQAKEVKKVSAKRGELFLFPRKSTGDGTWKSLSPVNSRVVQTGRGEVQEVKQRNGRDEPADVPDTEGTLLLLFAFHPFQGLCGPRCIAIIWKLKHEILTQLESVQLPSRICCHRFCESRSDNWRNLTQ